MRHPEQDAAMLLDAANLDRSDILLESEVGRVAGDQAFVREDPGRADGGVAGER